MRLIQFLILAFIVFSCTKKSETPEGALLDYIEGASSSAQSRDFYIKRTAGKLLAAVEGMSDDEFSDFNSLVGVKGVKFNILHKNCKTDECFITYEVEYRQSLGNPESEFENISKKIAELYKVEGQWKIADVTNIKSYIDSKTPIKVGPEK